MTLLRPITHKTPASVTAAESTGLPFGFILQPFAKCKSYDDAKCHTNNQGTTTTTTIKTSNRSSRRTNSNKPSSSSPTKSYLIAKCTHCGSPLNPYSRSINDWSALCNLCGNTFRIDYETQQGLRMAAATHNQNNQNQNQNNHHNKYNKTDDEFESEDGHDNNPRKTQYKLRYSRVGKREECIRHNIEYALPLFSASARTATTTIPTIPNEIYSLPAAMCPTLLTIIIDGTSTDPNYYNTIYSSLYHLINHSQEQNVSKQNFKGSRIGIFIMTKGGGLSIFDLKSPGGHIKHLWVYPSPLEPNTEHIQSQWNSKQDENDDMYEGRPSTPLVQRSVIPLSDVLDVEEIYVPLDSDYSRSCVESAIRVVKDSTIFNQLCQRNHMNMNTSYDNNDNSGDGGGDGGGGGTYLGSTIQYILEFFEDVTYHPGMNQIHHQNLVNQETTTSTTTNGNGNGNINDNDILTNNKFLYAGGKIMCFLASPPNEIGSPSSHLSSSSSTTGKVGTGGFGGSCAEIGKRYGRNTKTTATATTATITTNNMDKESLNLKSNGNNFHDIELGTNNDNIQSKNNTEHGIGNDDGNDDDIIHIPHTAFLEVDEYYQLLGMQSARQALSIEIFGLVNESSESSPPENNDDSGGGGTYLGFPYLRLLSDRSGGNGPLLVSLSKDDKSSGTCHVLDKEVVSRSTFTRPAAFGAVLRIRLSNSLSISKHMDEYDMFESKNKNSKTNNNNHKLFEYYFNNGMNGPVSVSSSSSNDTELYFTGSCDTLTTLSFELGITSNSETIDEFVYVNDSHRKLTPCIQTCFAYTGIEKINGNWSTVRRMRVCTLKLDTSDNTEAITSSLDSEALAVNRFHYLYASSLRNQNLTSVDSIARNWLLHALLKCYKSAESEMEVSRGRNRVREGFYPEDRLLDISGGSLSSKEKLLGRGHVELQLLPLLIFSLIQCDALRPKDGSTFDPSIDARCAAAATMGNMPPSVLSRCIAPRLELWMTDNEKEEVEGPAKADLGMSMDDIRFAIIDKIGLQEEKDEKKQTKHSRPRPLLLLDSPRQVIVHDCSNICRRDNSMEDGGERIPDKLKKAVRKAMESYRVPPSYKSSICDKGVRDNGVRDKEVLSHVNDALVEDSRLGGRSYDEWLSLNAEVLHSEIRNP